ncbi:MAG: hypothetical protein E7396_02435 [Ruminococcaceae bacterium]|nr:hypothetical protein [Oscillospiraceae bacterium]
MKKISLFLIITIFVTSVFVPYAFAIEAPTYATTTPALASFSVASSKGVELTNGANAPYVTGAHSLIGTSTANLNTSSAATNTVLLLSSQLPRHNEKTVIQFDAYSSVSGQGFTLRTNHYSTSSGSTANISQNVFFVSGTDFPANEWHRLSLEIDCTNPGTSSTYKKYVDGVLKETITVDGAYQFRQVRLIPYVKKNETYTGYFANTLIYTCPATNDYALNYNYPSVSLESDVQSLIIDNTNNTVTGVPDDYTVVNAKTLFKGTGLKEVRIYSASDSINPKDNSSIVASGDILAAEGNNGIVRLYTISTGEVIIPEDKTIIKNYTGSESLSLNSTNATIGTYVQNTAGPKKAKSDTVYRIYGKTGSTTSTIPGSTVRNSVRPISYLKSTLVNYDKVVVEFDVYVKYDDYGFPNCGIAVGGTFYDANDAANKNTMQFNPLANQDFAANKWTKITVEYNYSDYDSTSADKAPGTTYKCYIDGVFKKEGKIADGYYIPRTIDVYPYAYQYDTNYDVYLDNLVSYGTNTGYISNDVTPEVEGVASDYIFDSENKVIKNIRLNTTVESLLSDLSLEGAAYSVVTNNSMTEERLSSGTISDGDTLILSSADGIMNYYTLSVESDNGMSYEFSNNKPGYAGGRIKVRTSEDKNLTFYWGDASGKLADFTYLIKSKVNGGYTNYITVNKHIAIPEGATKLLAYEDDEIIYSYDLPEEKIFNYKKQVYSFGIMSDTHFGQRYLDQENKQNGIKEEPELVATLNKALDIFKSRGAKFITIAGDVVTANEQWEYDNYRAWVDAFVKDNPTMDFYVCSGNHDVMKYGDDNAGVTEDALGITNFSLLTGQSQYYKGDIVRKYNSTNQNYGFTIEYQGDLFIFLNQQTYAGNEINQEMFDWLEGLLDENTDNTVYLFFHLPVTTHSGSYIHDDGVTKLNGIHAHNTYSSSTGLTGNYTLGAKMKNVLYGRTNVVYISGHTHYSNVNQFIVNGVNGEYNYQVNIDDVNGHFGPMINVGSSAQSSVYDAIESTPDETFAESAVMRVFDDRMVFESFDVKEMKYQAFSTYVTNIASHKYDTMIVNKQFDGKVLKSVDFTIEDSKIANVFFAMYEGDKMIFADKAQYTESGIYTLDINKTISDGTDARIFIWESLTQAPLCKSVKLN